MRDMPTFTSKVSCISLAVACSLWLAGPALAQNVPGGSGPMVPIAPVPAFGAGVVTAAGKGVNTTGGLQTIPIDYFDVRDYGAVGDGASHPLSSVYATLAAAQAVYPFATSLTQELDWAGTQAATNAAIARGAGTIRLRGVGPYLLSDPIACATSSSTPMAFVGDEHQTHISNTHASASITFNCNSSVFATNVLTFENLSLTTNVATTGNIAFNIVNNQAVVFDNVKVYGYNQGISLTTSWAPIIRNGSYFQGIKTNAIAATDNSFKGATITGSTFAGNGYTTNTCAILVSQATGVTISGNDFSTNYCHVNFDDSSGIAFTGNYAEVTTAGAFTFTNVSGNSSAIEVTGNAFLNDTVANAVKYVAGFNLANNSMYASSWTFNSTATAVTGIGSNQLTNASTIGAPVMTLTGSPWVSSDGVKASNGYFATVGSNAQEIALTIDNPNTSSYATTYMNMRSNGATRAGFLAQQYSSGSGGDLYIFTYTTAGALATGITVDHTQNARAGNKLLATAAAPVLTSCGGGTPSVAAGSTSNGGQITIGTGATTACTATFATAFPAAAFCTITPASAYTGTYYISAQSASAFTFTLGTGTASAVFNYNCMGS